MHAHRVHSANTHTRTYTYTDRQTLSLNVTHKHTHTHMQFAHINTPWKIIPHFSASSSTIQWMPIIYMKPLWRPLCHPIHSRIILCWFDFILDWTRAFLVSSQRLLLLKSSRAVERERRLARPDSKAHLPQEALHNYSGLCTDPTNVDGRM